MVYEGLRTIDDVELRRKRVFLRVDYNVPLDKEGNIVDDSRIRESLPTIKAIFAKGASQIIIASHLGRPKGHEKELRMDKVAERLVFLLKRRVEKLDDCINVDDMLPEPNEASLVVLENLRFYPEEENDDGAFAKKLAKNSDFYVNDAFGVCHRAHASVHAITNFLPGCIGLLIEKELKAFNKALLAPEHPFVAIIGGSKLDTKLPLINNLLTKVDKILLGGAMIFTFYKAKGYGIGHSLVDEESVGMAMSLLNNPKLLLPVDVVVADDRDNPSSELCVPADKIPHHMIGLDVGSDSLKDFERVLEEAKLVVWNGPLGYYENKDFAQATMNLLKFLSERHHIKTIIGGGDTAALVERLGLRDRFYHVSTGGGASLEMLEGKILPGIAALMKKN